MVEGVKASAWSSVLQQKLLQAETRVYEETTEGGSTYRIATLVGLYSDVRLSSPSHVFGRVVEV